MIIYVSIGRYKKIFIFLNAIFDIHTSMGIANFEYPRGTYIRFSSLLWRYIGTHVSNLCRQVRPF